MVMVLEELSRLLGILYVSKHLNCSGKERFRHLLSIPGELLLTADQSRKSVLHRLVLIMDRTFGHALSGIKKVAEDQSKSSVFLVRKGLFPDLLVSSEGMNATRN